MANKIRISVILLNIFVGLFIEIPSANSSGIPSPNPFTPPHPSVYNEETFFVKAPALIGDVTVGVGGSIVGFVIGIPIGVVLMPQNSINIILVPFFAGGIAGHFGRKVGAAIVGFPFYVLQLVCYDLPKALFFPENSNENVEKEIALLGSWDNLYL